MVTIQTTHYIEVNKGYSTIRLDVVGQDTLVTVYNVNVNDVDLLIEKLQAIKADYTPKANMIVDEPPQMTAVLGPKVDEKKLAHIIGNRVAQGFSPRAIARQIEKEQKMSQIHLCKDCGQPMEVIEQEMFRGGKLTLITCKNPKCLLETVTLSPDQYNALDANQLESYREMNRKRHSGER